MSANSKSIEFKDRVAIVSGAGGGLGRQHALALASRGAKVVVNDLAGPASNRSIGYLSPAETVAAEINSAGGMAIASNASVTDEVAVAAMVKQVMDQWGRIDILVNNAGVLRDKSFAKMTLADFRLVLDVHVMGSVICTHAVWNIMRAQGYGRIVMTTSSSGLYGNFGQSNYGTAKMALVGLMQTLSIEGAKSDIRVNCLAPTAATQMTEGLLSEEMQNALKPELVAPAVLVLASEDAPSRTILCAGAGTFEIAYVTLTDGIHLSPGAMMAEELRDRFSEVGNRIGETIPQSAAAQATNEVQKGLAGY